MGGGRGKVSMRYKKDGKILHSSRPVFDFYTQLLLCSPFPVIYECERDRNRDID